MAGNEVVRVACEDCGGKERNHKVQRELRASWDNGDVAGVVLYQIVQCQGCEAIRFRSNTWTTEDLNPNTGEPESIIRVYPEHVPGARKEIADDYDDIPIKVHRIYRETLKALNSGALILAGTGLRAIVEAICLNAKAPGRNLQQKIDGLVQLKLLAEPQAELLHEERYLGNAAVHEVEPPARKQIEEGLNIVETLLGTMYIARSNAARLRRSRENKASARATLTAPRGQKKD